MNRKVFIGSSTESLDRAYAIRDRLCKIEGIECVLWKEVFEPGSLTFEALEDMLLRCCAAVFVATPDDTSVIRGRTIRCPRANVLLEFGLLAGRMGRHNVAVCRYGDAELPSDLTGLTFIEMEPDKTKVESGVHIDIDKKLEIWASRLVATVDSVARTDVVHGYTGRWDFHLRLDKWRDLDIAHPSFAQVNGSFDLHFSASGQTGKGLAHGRLFFKIVEKEGSDENVFQGEYRTSYEVTDACCFKDGSLQFTTQAFVLQKVNAVGTPPLQLEGLDFQPEPWSSQWKLLPSTDPRTLVGAVRTEGGGITQGTVKATKADVPQ